MQFRKYTKEEFISAINSSVSIAQALSKLGVKPSGGNYRTAHEYVKQLGLCTKHMTGMLWNKGKITGPKRPIQEYLNNTKFIQSHKLKLRLLKEKILDHKCSSCGITEWLGQPTPIELDHIDGNYKNNNLSNLRLLCPNCHAQTPTYRSKNKKRH